MRAPLFTLLAGAGALALASAAPALPNAPKPLTAFAGAGGKLGEGTARGPDNILYDCYAIEVPAGSEFTVSLSSSEFTPGIWIARGAHCTSAALQAQSDHTKVEGGEAKLSVKSAGGRYLIFARADDPAGAGRYRIKVTTLGAGLPGMGVAEASGGPSVPSASGLLTATANENKEDTRLALMRKQVMQRNLQLAAEAKARAEEEKQRQLALARQRELERQQQQSGGGDSGLFGALAMGLGAALGGGNTETVMGAAMKGMEMTTDDPNVRNALAGQGEAMMASGLGVSTGEVADALSGRSILNSVTGGNAGGIASGGGGGGNWRTEPAFGSSPACSMMNEHNYKEVALSGGNDVQLKTLCGAAWNYYWMYKNAKNQGYSAQDAEVTYQAHADAARVAVDFYENNRAD